MTSGVSGVSTWAGAASASSSFTIIDAVVIFVVAIVLLTVGLALVGRRTRLLVNRPRLRTAHSRRVRRAAEEDIREIEEDALRHGRGRPGQEVPSRDEENDDL